jgi:hypothetical protein
MTTRVGRAEPSPTKSFDAIALPGVGDEALDRLRPPLERFGGSDGPTRVEPADVHPDTHDFDSRPGHGLSGERRAGVERARRRYTTGVGCRL